jgi:uncharacterized membrane protein
VAILFTHTEVPFVNRLGVVGFVILVSIFPVALSLFELTCIVTGGRGNKVNLCGYYAWFITILVIIYCFILILVVLSSMFTYRKAYDKLTVTEAFNKMSPDKANDIAKDILKAPPEDEDAKKKDHFANAEKKEEDKKDDDKKAHFTNPKQKEEEKAHFENAPANAASAGSLLAAAPVGPSAFSAVATEKFMPF